MSIKLDWCQTAGTGDEPCSATKHPYVRMQPSAKQMRGYCGKMTVNYGVSSTAGDGSLSEHFVDVVGKHSARYCSQMTLLAWAGTEVGLLTASIAQYISTLFSACSVAVFTEDVHYLLS
jgi:hypothetical protein